MGDVRVYYDVFEARVEILAVVDKSEADEWLERSGWNMIPASCSALSVPGIICGQGGERSWRILIYSGPGVRSRRPKMCRAVDEPQ